MNFALVCVGWGSNLAAGICLRNVIPSHMGLANNANLPQMVEKCAYLLEKMLKLDEIF